MHCSPGFIVALLFAAALELVDAAPAPVCERGSTSGSSSSSSTSSCGAEGLYSGSVQARVPLTHPSPQGTIHLFHGTSAAHATNMLPPKSVNIGISADSGDFHRKDDVPGAFYLTDSLITAAQFECYRSDDEGEYPEPPRSVSVVEFIWTGGGPYGNAYTFPSENDQYNSFLEYNMANDDSNPGPNPEDPGYAIAHNIYSQYQMISGPMNGEDDKRITKSFWQYGIVNQNSIVHNLRPYKHHENILCKNVPSANQLTDDLYAASQFGNPAFDTRLAELQEPNYTVS